MSPEETCAVCGRTILAGEQVHGFTGTDGGREVCELCVGRAERLGWRRQGEGEELPGPGSNEGGEGWLAGLRRRRRAARPEATPAASSDDVPAETPARRADPDPDPAAPGMRTERPPQEPFGLSPFERAVARFNASEAGRTVGGLARTLGPPWVSVGASAGAPDEIRITVAWELSWYQWGVDLRDELRPVFELDKGGELEQLDTAARQWNASLDEDGRVVLATPAHQR